MKKIGVLFLSAVLAVSALAGCSSNVPAKDAAPAVPAADSSVAAPATDATAPAAPATGGLKTGFAVVSSIADSTDAGEKDGLAKTDSTFVAVLVDSEGKIVNCVIDGVQTAVNFSKEGKLLTDMKLTPPTKKELGADYGLAKASGIGKEWGEQVDALSAYVIGKTVDDVKGIAVTQGVPSGAELTASVTIHVGAYIEAIEKAVANATELGAQAGDKLGIAAVTNIEKSTDVGEKDGLAQAYSTYAAATFGADGKITSCIINGSQCNVNFDKTGKITTDLKGALKSKNELGADYGMKKASTIGKEWNEEAAAYAAYVTGKTVADLKGIAVTAEGAPSDAELAASVTVGIGGFNTVVEKAFATAK